MPKIGRNDPCPCGSGKKYKKCCMLGASMGSSHVPSFAKRILDERPAFALLNEGSVAFRRYYEEVRPHLPDFIVVHDLSIPVGVRARTTHIDGQSYLRLRTNVCPVEDAGLIAHELGHLLQDAEGFPSVSGLNDHPAAAALNSALRDPLIDAALCSYGFDRRLDRLAEIEESKRQLENLSCVPVDAAGKAHWVANCLGHVLAQHILGEDAAETEFLEWFSGRYPHILDEARVVADVVISIGFDTPKKMFTALDEARALLRAGGGTIGPPILPVPSKS